MPTISAKGQLVIPLEFRKKFNWKSGTRIEITEEKGKLILSTGSTRQHNDFLTALEDWDRDVMPAPSISSAEEDKKWSREHVWRKYESLSD